MTERFPLPADVQASFAMRARCERKRQARPCGEGVGGGRTCGAEPTRLFPFGARCGEHSPPPHVPDPNCTLSALRAAAGLRVDAFAVGRTVLDERAESSGRRVSSARRRAARGPAVPGEA